MRASATKIGLAVTALLLFAALPSAASAVVLFDQTGSPGGNDTFSMDYIQPNDVEAADDFTVPAGQQWTITEVDLLGLGAGFKFRVRIYSDAAGLPGTVLADQDEITPTNEPNAHLQLATPPVLGPGVYWLSVAASAFWSWRDSIADTGSPAVWQNPSGLFNAGACKTWTARTTCYPASAGEPGQAFKLIGPEPTILPTAGPPAKPSNAFTFGALNLNKKKGVGALAVNLPGAGTVSLSGKGLKGVSTSVAAAGAVKLTLKATGKAKKKLKKKGKAKLKAAVTFTPTGGDPATQTKSVTLKKKKKKKAASSK